MAAVAAWASAAPGAAAADPAFKDIIVGSPSYTSAVGHLCYSADGTVEVACPASSPFISSGGLLGIGTESPAYPLDVSGTVRATSFIGDGSGLTGVVASTGDRIVSGTTRMVADGATGLISITQAGTNTAYFHPQLGLVTVGVSSTGGVSGTRVYSSGVAVAEQGFFSNNNSSFGWGSGSQTAIVGTAISRYIAFNTSGTEAMRIVSSGFVGIGTSAPSYTLDVSGSIASRNASGKALVMTMTPNGDSFIGDNGAGGGSFYLGAYSNSNYFRLSQGSGSFTVSASGPSRIIGTGGLGVGQNLQTPSTTLHVSGTIRMADGGEACDANRTGAIKYSGGDFSICRNGSAWESLSAVAAGAVSVTDGLSGSLVFRDQAGALHGHPTISVSATTGSVGIGAGAPGWLGNNALYTTGNILGYGAYVSSGKGLYIGSGTSALEGSSGAGTDYLSFKTSGTEAMRVVSSGFVGIGTSTPNAALHVSGTFKVGGSGGTGKLYLSDSSNALSTYLTGMTGAQSWINSYGGMLGIGTSYPSTTLHVSGTARLTSWTMIGANASPTEALEVAGSIKASGSIKVSGTGGETCTGSADTGRIRVNPVTGRLQLCAPL